MSNLRERELEVLNLMAKGLTNKEIADELYVTTYTIRWHIRKIYQKLGTSIRIKAIIKARKLELLKE